MEPYKLTPVNGRKSFYGKCEVHRINSIDRLVSYGATVAEYDPVTKEMTVYGWYSTTTTTHINAFLVYNGFPTLNKEQMENWNIICKEDFQTLLPNEFSTLSKAKQKAFQENESCYTIKEIEEMACANGWRFDKKGVMHNCLTDET